MIAARVLRSRLRLARAALFARRQGARARPPFVVLALLTAMAWLSYQGFLGLLRALVAAGATPAELTALLGVTLDATTVSLVVLGLDATVATLLLDPDLELLRRAPVRPASLLALKLLDAIPRTGAPLVVLALPAILAFAAVRGAGPAAFPLAALAASALWVLALGLGVALALPLLRAVPARRAREALGLVATLVLTSAWLANALWLPRLADSAGSLEGLRGALDAFGAAPAFTPGRAAAEMLGAAPTALATGAKLAALALAAWTLAALAATVALPRVLESLAAPPPRAAASRPRLPADARAPRGWLRSVLARDARLFLRDWTVMADVLTAAVLWTLLPFLSRAIFETGGPALVTSMLASLAIGLGYEVAARSIPFERRAATWMQLAPVPPGRWVAAKLAGAALVAGPIFLAGWLALSLAVRLEPLAAARALAIGLAALTLSLGLGLWAGTRFGDPRWTNPRAMLTMAGRLTAAGLMMVQITFWIGLTLALDGAFGRRGSALVGPIAIIAVLVSALPIRSSSRRIARLGWYA